MAITMARAMGAIIVLCCVGSGSATVYTVGEANGWSTNVDYSTWTSGKTFSVGDSLDFNYGAGAHSVDEVSASDYKSCATGNSITSDSSGTTSITLKTAGTHYFICGVIGHCSLGMKMAVPVGAATTTSPSTPTTTTPPSSTTTSPPTPTTTTTTTTSSHSASNAISPSMGILLFGVALLKLGLF
ncbi:mavicyanin-like [Tasmannia lanceolata]|uniref:mavicyanin-like n=1 Tax=Tasmannia lanceolata TaxID=3420 RepID=UPI004062AB25